MKTTLALLLLSATVAIAQTTPNIKSSPASNALDGAAKELIETQKSLSDGFEQARSALQTNQKKLQADIGAASKALNDKLKRDKKYKGDIDAIDGMQKQLQELAQTAQANYTTKFQPLQQKVATDSALIDGLIPVVRKENGLPDAATYDKPTQKWTVPK